MAERPPLVAEIETIILSYLQAHPQAADTERGIHEWWLRTADRTYTADDVLAAIQRLVATGELAMHQLQDGRVIYYASAGPPPSRNS